MGLVPYMTSFCCCIGLEVGAKVIGFLHMLFSLILCIVCVYFAISFSQYVGTAEDIGDEVYRTWARLCVSAAVFSLVHTVTGGTLVYGAYKRSLIHLRVYVWVMCSLVCVGVLFCIVVSVMYGLSDTGSHIFIAFLEGLMFFGFVTYCIICVNSYAMLVKNSEDYSPKGNY